MEGVERAYRLYGDKLLAYLWRLSGDRALAQDILHDTFVRLAERPPDGDQVRSWLFTVATNRLRDLTKLETRRVDLLRGALPFVISDPPSEVTARLDRREARERLAHLLRGLHERDRQILLLREAGLRHREIAEVIGTTTGSVGTMLGRALRRAQQAIASDKEAPS